MDMFAEQQKSTEPTPMPGALPWYYEEKYYWNESPTGRPRLSPRPEYKRAVEDDAPKLVEYGRSLLRPEGGSTEGGVVDELQRELTGVLQSLTTLDDREDRALRRFLRDRATRNAVYAAATQTEIERWVAKAAARGQDASEQSNFALKESRRDNFALIAAAYAELVNYLCPDDQLKPEDYVKSARQVIYQQADKASREQLSPHEERQRADHAVQAAILAARPI